MTTPSSQPSPTTLRRALAWCVHAYTALGLICAAGMAEAALRGGDLGLRDAFAWMFLATLIDATDGFLARRFDVKNVLPRFDGRRLDDITDFLTYTTLPLFVLSRAAVLPEDQAPWLLVPLLASAYGFAQADIKTDDGSFLGFPSLWNIVAFYLVLLRPPPSATLAILIALSLLTFIPLRYPYPSRPGLLNRLTRFIGAAWAFLLVAILWQMPAPDPTLVRLSLIPPLAYLLAPWIRLAHRFNIN